MEKQDVQPDSLATVAVKEYAPSESYTEPPPAYHKPRSTAVQVTRIVAVTLILMSIILGAFILAAAWVQASASCQHLQEQLLQQQQQQHQDEVEDSPSYQQLVDPLQSEESVSGDKVQNVVPPPHQEHQQQQENQEHNPIHIKLPLTLDFDELAGSMVEKNQRSRMNCVVEKRRAEEVVDHAPRTVKLPFGLNLTTDPRYEHVTGERMAIFCESGKDQRHVPMEMMATPVVVPLPGPVHLPLQFQGPTPQQQMQHQQMLIQQIMREQQQQQLQQQQQRARAQNVQQIPLPLHAAIQVTEARQLPVHITEARRIPVQEAEARRVPIQVTEARQIPIQITEMHHVPIQVAEAHQIPIHMAEGRHIPIQIAEGRHIPIQMAEGRHIPIQMTEGRHIPIQMTEGRHIPEARHMPFSMPEGRHVPIQVAEARQVPIQVAEEHHIPIQITEAHPIPLQQLQEPREEPQMLRMTQAREGRAFQSPRLPVHVPVPMMEQEQPRPHYVQPRSVRSVDDVFLHKREKRMRRCACDCSC